MNDKLGIPLNVGSLVIYGSTAQNDSGLYIATIIEFVDEQHGKKTC